jgi:hypothetical protein
MTLGDSMRFVRVAASLLVASTVVANDLDQFENQHRWFVENTENWDIFVATVKSSEPAEGTNQSPPVVRLEIEEVLRGTLRPGTLTAEWSIFYGFRCRETRQEREVYYAWLRRPLPGPTKGSRWLFGGYRGASGTYIIHPHGRFEYDSAFVEWAREAIAAFDARSVDGP